MVYFFQEDVDGILPDAPSTSLAKFGVICQKNNFSQAFLEFLLQKGSKIRSSTQCLKSAAIVTNFLAKKL